jgi:hypothetical protein
MYSKSEEEEDGKTGEFAILGFQTLSIKNETKMPL